MVLAALWLLTWGVTDAGAQDVPKTAITTPPAEAGEDDAEKQPEKAADEEASAEEGAPVREGPLEVTVGVHVNDVQAIDMKTHSYALDAYVWLRWTGEDADPSSTLEFTNASEAWGHVLTPLYEEPESLEDGSLYQVLRITGRFSRKMPLNDYPFDEQAIVLGFEDTQLNTEGLRYVLGDPPVTVNPDLSLPGYEFLPATLTVSEFKYPTTFGDPRLGAPDTYSRTLMSLPIARPAFAYSIKLILPFFCATACAALMFLLAPRYVEPRISIGITALLTIVALQMTFNETLPDVGYLTLMDKLYVWAYLYVIAGLAVAVRTAQMVLRDEEAAATRLHLRSLMVLTTAYVGGIAWHVLSAL